jgi:transcriptional regulator with AAA-type ATPase domain
LITLPGTKSETYDFPGNVGELKKMVVEVVRGGESGDISLEPFREKIGDF